MPNKDGTANVGDALKSIGIALVAALLIVAAGTSKHDWLVIPVTAIVSGAGGYLATRKDDKKVKLTTIGKWGAFGLVAGVMWYAFA